MSGFAGMMLEKMAISIDVRDRFMSARRAQWLGAQDAWRDSFAEKAPSADFNLDLDLDHQAKKKALFDAKRKYNRASDLRNKWDDSREMREAATAARAAAKKAAPVAADSFGHRFIRRLPSRNTMIGGALAAGALTAGAIAYRNRNRHQEKKAISHELVDRLIHGRDARSGSAIEAALDSRREFYGPKSAMPRFDKGDPVLNGVSENLQKKSYRTNRLAAQHSRNRAARKAADAARAAAKAAPPAVNLADIKSKPGLDRVMTSSAPVSIGEKPLSTAKVHRAVMEIQMDEAMKANKPNPRIHVDADDARRATAARHAAVSQVRPALKPKAAGGITNWLKRRTPLQMIGGTLAAGALTAAALAYKNRKKNSDD